MFMTSLVHIIIMFYAFTLTLLNHLNIHVSQVKSKSNLTLVNLNRISSVQHAVLNVINSCCVLSFLSYCSNMQCASGIPKLLCRLWSTRKVRQPFVTLYDSHNCEAKHKLYLLHVCGLVLFLTNNILLRCRLAVRANFTCTYLKKLLIQSCCLLMLVSCMFLVCKPLSFFKQLYL